MVQVGVVRKKDIIQSVKTSVQLAGGMKIEKNSTVLIRPNANDPAKIIVAEKSMTTLDTIKVMKHLGLYQAAESEGSRKEIQIRSDGVKEIESIEGNIDE